MMFEFEFSILQAHQVLHPLLLALTTRPAPPIQSNALPRFPIIITSLHKLLIYLIRTLPVTFLICYLNPHFT